MYLKYLKSLLLHKWFVFRAGLHTGTPLLQLIIHDWSKFLLFTEFIPYARYFGHDRGKALKPAFDEAWLHHQNHNPHHWQYWLLIYDQHVNKCQALPMPREYVAEMVADWMGASRAYTGSWDMSDWLSKNGPKMILHPDTKTELDFALALTGHIKKTGADWEFEYMGGLK